MKRLSYGGMIPKGWYQIFCRCHGLCHLLVYRNLCNLLTRVYQNLDLIGSLWPVQTIVNYRGQKRKISPSEPQLCGVRLNKCTWSVGTSMIQEAFSKKLAQFKANAFNRWSLLIVFCVTDCNLFECFSSWWIGTPMLCAYLFLPNNQL